MCARKQDTEEVNAKRILSDFSTRRSDLTFSFGYFGINWEKGSPAFLNKKISAVKIERKRLEKRL